MKKLQKIDGGYRWWIFKFTKMRVCMGLIAIVLMGTVVSYAGGGSRCGDGVVCAESQGCQPGKCLEKTFIAAISMVILVVLCFSMPLTGLICGVIALGLAFDMCTASSDKPGYSRDVASKYCGCSISQPYDK